MKVRAFLYSLLIFTFICFKLPAASVCNVQIPGTYQQSGADPDFEIEVFKKMPHFQYYLRSQSHPLSLIVGEKVLAPETVKSLNKNTIGQWAQEQLQSTIDIYSQTKFKKKKVKAFINILAGYRTTLAYNNQFEQRLLIVKSLDCAIEFIAIGALKDSELVEQTVSNFLVTLKGNKKGFWIIPNSYWYTDLGPTNQIALTILLIMIAISVGLVFYVRKKDL